MGSVWSTVDSSRRYEEGERRVTSLVPRHLLESCVLMFPLDCNGY